MVDRSDEGSETGTDDVRSALAAAFTEHEAPVETVETPAEEPERPSRARAPDGKFAKADEAPETEATLNKSVLPSAPRMDNRAVGFVVPMPTLPFADR